MKDIPLSHIAFNAYDNPNSDVSVGKISIEIKEREGKNEIKRKISIFKS